MELIEELSGVYLEHRDLSRVEPMETYLKNQFKVLGLSAPRWRQLSKPFIKKMVADNNHSFEEYIRRLWNSEYREFHYTAVELLIRAKRQWTADTLALMQYMITTHSWWDTVDAIATNGVGPYLQKYPQKVDLMDEWNVDDNLWLNRTSIIYQLKYKKQTDLQRLSRYILQHQGSKEFFHQKAMGWALRQISKFEPDWVAAFIDQHELPSLTVREGSKYLP